MTVSKTISIVKFAAVDRREMFLRKELGLPHIVINSFKLSVAHFGQQGEHVERPAVSHVKMVGLQVQLSGLAVVGRRVDLLPVAGQVAKAEQQFLSGHQRQS